MVYLIFQDGTLRGVSTDKTDASQQAQQILKDDKPECVMVVAVNGHVQEAMYADDRDEA